MNTGDIVIVSFPFTDLTTFKARPAVVVCETPDFNDLIICLITSIVPATLLPLQIILHPNTLNNLRSISVIKVYRITTVESSKVLATIGKLSEEQMTDFKQKFASLVYND